MNESPEFVTLQIEDKMVRLPVVVGSEGEKAIDIANLRRETGYVTLDPSFMNTAACYSQITYIDGEKRHSALSRHSDRGSGQENHVRRGRVPARSRGTADRG